MKDKIIKFFKGMKTWSLKGFNTLYFIIRNKAKILALVNILIPYDTGLRAIISTTLVLGEEIYKYASKEKTV